MQSVTNPVYYGAQLNVQKCHECGQPLPESFQPPADEPWTTGIFGCTEDRDSCKSDMRTSFSLLVFKDRRSCMVIVRQGFDFHFSFVKLYNVYGEH